MMTNIDLIKKYLPEDLWSFASNFDIQDEYIIDMPDVIVLILRSKSIDTDQEKQNWFNLLPLMNDEQFDKLKDILLREKQKLEEIEQKYEEKKDEIKRKYLLKWQKMGYINTVNQIHETEQVDKTREQEEAERLLDML